MPVPATQDDGSLSEVSSSERLWMAKLIADGQEVLWMPVVEACRMPISPAVRYEHWRPAHRFSKALLTIAGVPCLRVTVVGVCAETRLRNKFY